MTSHKQAKDRYAHVEFEGVRFPDVQRLVPPAPLVGEPLPVGPVIATQLGVSDYSLLAMVLAHAGVDLKRYRQEALVRRVPACLRALRVRNATEACLKLQENPVYFDLAIDALLIGVTHFFRDSAVFDLLEQTIIPDILAQMPGCRVLSVACSDGAELYSVGIFLAELGILNKSLLLGVDCRSTAISSARSGWFAASSLKHIPEGIIRRYFSSANEQGAVIDPLLRMSTSWKVADALTYEAGHQWDLILCRNLAIYLNPSVTVALWNRLSAMLAPGGYLIVGKAEKPTAGFVRMAPCVYRKPS